jgi:hypothetical protein
MWGRQITLSLYFVSVPARVTQRVLNVVAVFLVMQIGLSFFGDADRDDDPLIDDPIRQYFQFNTFLQ